MVNSYFIHKSRSRKFWTIVGWVILGIVGITVFAFLFGYVVMLLWNWLMPELFGLKEIVFWQAVGVIILAKLLFGGFSGHKSRSSSKKDHSKSHRSKCDEDKFSKWKYYDKFWKEEGETAFKAYIGKKENNSTIDSEQDQKEY
jgi:hypothetical protein